MRRIRQVYVAALLAALMVCAFMPGSAGAQGQAARRAGGVRAVTIPVTMRGRGPVAEFQPAHFTVLENNEPQQVISIRDLGRAPLSLAVLIQDDVVPSISNEIRSIAEFVRRLPEGSRVMVGYIRSGSLQVSQRFTTNTQRAAASLRVPLGSTSVAPFNPYIHILDALRRFEGQPAGRRALIVVSDGLDISRGIESSTPGSSVDLERAIQEAQRQGVAVYSFYAPTVTFTATRIPTLVSNAQGSLNRLSQETGGRAFFQGTGAPVSFEPFLRETTLALLNQFALTYLSTNPERGAHRVRILTEIEGLELSYPTGYTRR